MNPSDEPFLIITYKVFDFLPLNIGRTKKKLVENSNVLFIG